MHKLCLCFILSLIGFLEVDSWVVWYKPFFSPLGKFSFILSNKLTDINRPFHDICLAPENPQQVTYFFSICVDTPLDHCSLKMLPVLVSECFTQSWLTCHTFLPQWPPAPPITAKLSWWNGVLLSTHWTSTSVSEVCGIPLGSLQSSVQAVAL